jgi:hypothetical protein
MHLSVNLSVIRSYNLCLALFGLLVSTLSGIFPSIAKRLAYGDG